MINTIIKKWKKLKFSLEILCKIIIKDSIHLLNQEENSIRALDFRVINKKDLGIIIILSKEKFKEIKLKELLRALIEIITCIQIQIRKNRLKLSKLNLINYQLIN